MTLASRRKARRLRAGRRALAEARVNARRAEIAAGLRQDSKLYTRKDREALNVRGDGKQRSKHAGRRRAKARGRLERRHTAALVSLRAATAGGAVQVVSVELFGSSAPFVAGGTVCTSDGADLVWAFRYRYDRAFLEVGGRHAEHPHLVGDCFLAASREDVTGNPYGGHLEFREALDLLADLFAELGEPVAGDRFSERLANTVDLATGRGGDPHAPTLVRVVPAEPSGTGLVGR